MRTRCLKGQKEFVTWSKSSSRPPDIPADPGTVYKTAGWRGLRDFLGDGWRSFESARAFMRTQGFRSIREFKAWRMRPKDIPSNPNVTYKGKGWRGHADFLGYDHCASLVRSKARVRRKGQGQTAGRGGEAGKVP